MRLHQTRLSGNIATTGYGQGFIEVYHIRHETPLLLLPERLEAWVPPPIESFSREDFHPLITLNPEVILLGTGANMASHLFPLVMGFEIGIEIMTTPTALYTFNFLVAEERRVLAALYLP